MQTQPEPDTGGTQPGPSLSAGEARFRAVVDGFSDPLLILDTYAVVRYVNAEFLAFFGYARADVIGRPFEDLLPPDERSPVLAWLAGSQPAPSAPLRFEHHLRQRDGAAETVETSANTLSDPSGERTLILHLRVITEHKRAEESLRASEERYRYLVEHSHDLIQSVAPDGRLLYVNRTWRETLGYAEPDLPRLHLRDIVHPDAWPEHEQLLAGLWRGQDVGVLRTAFVTRRGAMIEVEGVGAAQYEGGRPVAVNTFYRNVTAHNQSARVQAARFAVSHILAASPELDVALAQAVEAIAANLGWHAAELWLPAPHGHELCLQAGWQRPGYPELAAFAQSSRPLTFARQEGLPGWIWATGEALWEVDVAASRLFRRGSLALRTGLRSLVAVPISRDHEVVGVMVFMSRTTRPVDEPMLDILVDLGRQLGQFAARKGAEAALIAERASLARRVEERTADLSHVNAELARAVRAKDEFLANMSHELRTPLNAVLALSEVLLEEVRGPLTPQQRDSLRSIEASGQHLLALINDILDLSKIEAGHLELRLEALAVADICQASLVFVKELALRKQLQLSFHLNDQLAMMEADPKRLKQMLVNLLSNAVKFTHLGGKVSLAVTVQPEAGSIVFTVEDNGIGITREDQVRLFQPFTQLDSRLNRQHEGSGLGLALVWRLAQLHGGSVAVESEPDQGSCFTLTLPYRPPRIPVPARLHPAPQTMTPGPAPTQARILLAEDNESNVQVIGDYLGGSGYRVEVARNGREAIDKAVAARPDLILLDVQMPEIDGLEVARQLRALPAFTAVPIIALTALAMPDDRERCIAAGATEYMSKPVSLRALRGLIERLLAS